MLPPREPADAGHDAAPASCGPGAEVEPNDTYATAGTLVSGAGCGALASATDQDWFWYSAAKGPFSIALTASGDAEMQIGQDVGGKCAASMVSLTSLSLTAATAQRYCIRVVSSTGKAQSYSLSAH